jgi:uncharacterized membrane protein
MRLISRVNGMFAWMNTLLLLAVSFIPFPTSLLGEYPFQRIPMVIYGLDLLAVNLISLGMLHYVYKRKDLASEHYTKDILRNFFRIFLYINIGYALAVGLAFFAPAASYALYVIGLIAAIYIYASREE